MKTSIARCVCLRRCVHCDGEKQVSTWLIIQIAVQFCKLLKFCHAFRSVNHKPSERNTYINAAHIGLQSICERPQLKQFALSSFVIIDSGHLELTANNNGCKRNCKIVHPCPPNHALLKQSEWIYQHIHYSHSHLHCNSIFFFLFFSFCSK